MAKKSKPRGTATIDKRLAVKITHNGTHLVCEHLGSGFKEYMICDDQQIEAMEAEFAAQQFGDPLSAKHYGDHIMATYAVK